VIRTAVVPNVYCAAGNGGFFPARTSASHNFHSAVLYGHFSISTHHAGGSGARKKDLRCARVRQRGMIALAWDTKLWILGKTSQTRAVSSRDAVTMRRPSGLKAALITHNSWPLSGSLIGWPLAASQIRAVLSEDAVTIRVPSGLNAALQT
jgi:hypothetical protein